MLWAVMDFSTVGTSSTSTCRASRERFSTRRVNMGRAWNGAKTSNLGNVLQGRNSKRCTSSLNFAGYRYDLERLEQET